jgi:hypothetical protein
MSTQFGSTIKTIQCDNGREFDNSCTRSFLLTHGVLLRMSCPYTSPQNGKDECIIRSINNVMCSILFQASLPAAYWVESLHTATFLLNQLPTKTIHASCPYFALFSTTPTYEHLHAFGCACYPNMSATAPHKLAPRSASCVLLGYSDHHKGYRCHDLSTNRLVITRHVVFDEAVFPFAASPHPTDSLDFLPLEEAPVVPPIGTPLLAGSTAPRAAALELMPSSLESPHRAWPPRHHAGSHWRCLRVSCLVRPRRLLSYPTRPQRLLPLRRSIPVLPHGCGLLHRSPTSVVHVDLRLQWHPHFRLRRSHTGLS